MSNNSPSSRKVRFSDARSTAIFYFPVILMGIVGLGLVCAQAISLSHNLFINLILLILSLTFIICGIVLSVKILLAIAESIRHEKDSQANTKSEGES